MFLTLYPSKQKWFDTKLLQTSRRYYEIKCTTISM